MKKPTYLYVVEPIVPSIERRRVKASAEVRPMKEEPGRWLVGGSGEMLWNWNGFTTFAQAKRWLIAWQREAYARAKRDYLKALHLTRAKLV